MTVYFKLTVIQMVKVTMAINIYKMSITELDEDISIYVRDLSRTCVQDWTTNNPQSTELQVCNMIPQQYFKFSRKYLYRTF